MQETEIDSTVLKATIVKKDIRHFYLSKQNWKACRKQHFKPTSDYFKPNGSNIENPKLLSDSDYVKAFRVAAYKKTLKRRTVGNYVLVGGGIYVAGIVIGTVVFILGLAFGFVKL